MNLIAIKTLHSVDYKSDFSAAFPLINFHIFLDQLSVRLHWFKLKTPFSTVLSHKFSEMDKISLVLGCYK